MVFYTTNPTFILSKIDTLFKIPLSRYEKYRMGAVRSAIKSPKAKISVRSSGQG
jgi:hypothetical protein